MQDTKKCSKCKEVKSPAEFYNNKYEKSGKTSQCKACINTIKAIRYRENIEKFRLQDKLRREATPGYKEKHKEQNAAWYKNTRDLRIAKNRKWKEENKERCVEYSAQWRRDNSELVRTQKSNRRARELGNGGTLSPGITKKLYEQQQGLCPCCGLPLEVDYHLDHIFPLALGGTNSDDNVQLLRAVCNMQKGALPPEVFMEKRGFKSGENALTKLDILR